MKVYRITLEGDTFDVEVLGDPRREHVQVRVNGEIFTVGVEVVPVLADVLSDEAALLVAPAGVASPTPKGAARAGPSQMVNAPLPGVIKSIAVRPGHQVVPDDELLVIEAMKMDNIIRATRAGTIGTIFVAEGRQVAYGEALLEMSSGE